MKLRIKRRNVGSAMASLLMVCGLGPAQADTVIPLVVGYNTTYSSTRAGSITNAFTSTLQITGTKTINGTEWWIVQFGNWDGDGRTNTTDIRATATELYFGESLDPHVVIGGSARSG